MLRTHKSVSLVTMTMRDFLYSDDTLDTGRNLLVTSGALSRVTEALEDTAQKLPGEFDHVPHRVRMVWLACLLEDAARLLRDQQAGRGQAEGVRVADLGAGAGQGPTTIHRKMPSMRAFRQAQEAADLTGQSVTVDAYGYRWAVEPIPSGGPCGELL